MDPTPSTTSGEVIEQEDNHQDEEERTFENVSDVLTLYPEKNDNMNCHHMKGAELTH